MSFSSNFKTRMLFLDQSYNVTKHRGVLFAKIWQNGQRIGMRMTQRSNAAEVLAEAYIDGTIIIYQAFERLAYRVQREIKDTIAEVAVLVSEDIDPSRTYNQPRRQVYQRKLLYATGASLSGAGDFADFLTKKFQPGSQQGVQPQRR